MKAFLKKKNDWYQQISCCFTKTWDTKNIEQIDHREAEKVDRKG